MTLHLMGRARIFHPPHSQHFFLCHRFQLIEAISMAQPNIGQVSTHRSLTFTLWSSHHGCQMHPTVGRAPEIASSWLYISVLVHVTIFGTAREKEPPNKIPAKINDRRIKSKYARAMWRKQWDLCRCCGCCCCCAWESEEAKREKYQQLYNDRSRDGIMRQNVERKNAFSVFFIQTPFPFGKREKSGTQKPFSSLKAKLFRSILMKTTS